MEGTLAQSVKHERTSRKKPSRRSTSVTGVRPSHRGGHAWQPDDHQCAVKLPKRNIHELASFGAASLTRGQQWVSYLTDGRRVCLHILLANRDELVESCSLEMVACSKTCLLNCRLSDPLPAWSPLPMGRASEHSRYFCTILECALEALRTKVQGQTEM